MTHKPGYLRGVNYSHQRKIKKLAEAGATAEEISVSLRVDVDIIENFMPETEEKPKRKRRTKEEMAADEAKAQEAEE